MMRISTKGRYALRVMLDLAMQRQDVFIPLKDISSRQKITIRYMEIIMSILLKAGFVISTRGKSGGYRLAREPREYSLYEILTAAEGSLAPIECLTTPANTCALKETCLTLPVWQGLDQLITDYFKNITIDDLIQKTNALSFGAGI